MSEENQTNKIKEIATEFFLKMTIQVSKIEADFTSFKKDNTDKQDTGEEIRDVINISINLEEPQILIGQGGQTLFEIQRLLRTILSKKLGKIFYLNLDINEYKRKKEEYLKSFVQSSADEVTLSKKEKSLSPMSAYERRIVHSELSQRTDIITESQGEGASRYIVIKPR
jgi:spoIIIJ-associated protein